MLGYSHTYFPTYEKFTEWLKKEHGENVTEFVGTPITIEKGSDVFDKFWKSETFESGYVTYSKR